MGITAELAKLSAAFFGLPPSDGKFYAIKDKTFAEVTGGGGGLFTKSNWREWVYNGVYSSRGNRGHFNREGIGFSVSMADRLNGVSGTFADFRVDDFTVISLGTGSGIQLPTLPNVGYSLVAGTDTTSNVKMFHTPVVYSKLADGTSYRWNEIGEVWYTGRMVVPTALSTATQRYTVSWVLQVASIMQARFSYTDNVNGGKWNFTYTNATNSQISVDTGITAVAATGYTPTIQLWWNAATSLFNLTVTFGVFTATYTSLRINSQLTTYVQDGTPAITNAIEKAAGTGTSVARVISSFVSVSLK